MNNYDVQINRLLKESNRGIRTEIWANITDITTCETTSKLIWWEDDNGVPHDETPKLPTNLRAAVDNAWIEKSRKWWNQDKNMSFLLFYIKYFWIEYISSYLFLKNGLRRFGWKNKHSVCFARYCHYDYWYWWSSWFWKRRDG